MPWNLSTPIVLQGGERKQVIDNTKQAIPKSNEAPAQTDTKPLKSPHGL